jgi:hypothetical protein
VAEPAERGEPSDPGPGETWGALARTFDSPASYVIRVAGGLDPDRSDYLQGLRITTAPGDPAGGGTVTELRGVLRDQAALLGVLNALYNLRLPLLTVARLPAPADASRPA